jgi:hypothetical protein
VVLQPIKTKLTNHCPKSLNMKKTLTTKQQSDLLKTLQTRFEKNVDRHKGISWKDVETKLNKNADKMWSILQMEETGGEPDVVGYDKKTDTYTFFDCSPESPAGRRSFCYDQEALESRKENKPKNSAVGMANTMGVQLLTEEEYRMLQQLGKFDLKTSSWVKTPKKIRELGGALFCDRRFDTVFVYHNGVESYYAARAFRAMLTV